jgi:transcriptional regulator with XRE-family HTH domain
MYSHLFNQTQLNNYKLAQILNVSITQIIQYRKSKNVNYERLFEFMQKLEIKEFEFNDGKIKINVKL